MHNGVCAAFCVYSVRAILVLLILFSTGVGMVGKCLFLIFDTVCPCICPLSCMEKTWRVLRMYKLGV